ncbi:sulfur carrier protein ThiS [Smaragdicoccus niigatensis]|uniref:sulfur carrier protein ThiS n=1 Tax=Smaragdicoccus niigatensis TaxID=359359 RepID=UPI000368303E|nr:sulfur carrier protein ThiS [Smaragdicoccus niigatensis]
MSSIPVGVTVNGEDRMFDSPLTMRDLLGRLDLPEKGIAIAVDGAVFPRGRWDEQVQRGSTIEILTAVQGG